MGPCQIIMLLGNSPAFRALKAQLEKVTKSNGRVMLTGPAGSGKEMAARFIHSNSNRASAPFISVSSATIEPERMEEVLFGRERRNQDRVVSIIPATGLVNIGDHPELFHATCGGMGLTGVIVDASFDLIPITSALISVDMCP